MKRIRVSLLLLTCLFYPPFALTQEEAPKPSYRNGDSWQFKAREWDMIGKTSNSIDGTYELSMTDGRLKVFVLSGDQKDELEPRPNTLIALLGLTRNLDFPLSVGKKWNYNYKLRLPGATRERERKVEVTVVGAEQITTAAGTFRVYKLEMYDSADAKDTFVTTYWYSPETKSVVKYFFDSSVGAGAGGKREIELTKFNPAK